MTIMEVLPMIIYLLLIALLIVLIIIGIKLIFIVDKADKLMDNIEQKVNVFNPVFKLVDLTSSKLTSGITSIVESVINLFNKLFKKNEESEEDYNE